MGLFWGYNVWVAKTFSEIFQNLSEKCLKVLIDNEEEESDVDVDKWLDDKLKEDEEIDEIFLFFSGEGIKTLFDSDELTKIRFGRLKERFDLRLNPLKETMGFKKIHVDEQVMHYCHKFFNFN